MLAVRKDLGLEGQEDTCRVDQVDDRQPILERDLLGTQHLLAGGRKPGTGLDRGVVGNDHGVATADPTDTDDHARRRRTAPFLVLTPGRPQTDLEERRARITELGNALARRQLAPRPLLVVGLATTAQTQLGLLLLDEVALFAPVSLTALVDLDTAQLAADR